MRELSINASQVVINSVYDSINFQAFCLQRGQEKLLLCVYVWGEVGKRAVVTETQKGVKIHPDLRHHGGTGFIHVSSAIHPALSPKI